MTKPSMLIVVLAAMLVPGGAARAEPVEAMPDTLMLFGASWCAPCRAELARMEELAALAAPLRIVVAWLDRAPAVPAAGARVLEPAAARAAFQRLVGDNQGVPVTALIDRAGRLCASVPASLDKQTLARLRARCGSGR